MEDEERRETKTDAMQAEDAEMMERLQEEIRNLPVAEHLIYMMDSLSTLAVGRMGLAPDAKSGQDLEQARLAIDPRNAVAVAVGVRECFPRRGRSPMIRCVTFPSPASPIRAGADRASGHR